MSAYPFALPLFSPLLEQAIELAAQWHDRTYRKGGWRNPAFSVPDEALLRVPVMAHLTAVALTVQRAGWGEAVVAAAFLHDSLEDANHYADELSYEALVTLIGQPVADLVRAVTEEKYAPDGTPQPWKVRKTGYLAQLQTAPVEALAISLADKLHNLWSMNEALVRGIDVFANSPSRRRLSAGPLAQRWFYQAVYQLAADHPDTRLTPLREALDAELQRFVQLLDNTLKA